ncbi:M1 family aminopeptidase [Bacteroidota bacterium]
MKKISANIMKMVLVPMVFAIAISCSKPEIPELSVPGVSRELAVYRRAIVSSLEYELGFTIPAEKDSLIRAWAKIGFELKAKLPVLLDFKPSYTIAQGEKISAKVNGRERELEFVNEHIVLPERYMKMGQNVVEIEFRAGEQSLNRRDELLYTLLVPDRARTLFPCFDQPDLKAIYTLNLEIPKDWVAVANGKVTSADTLENSVKMAFSPTEPISTYLFSFVAGKFRIVKEVRDGREINIYHREEDPLKLAQIPVIYDQIYSSLKWLEDYTAIAYPFTKYDIAIVPGFQYGGMEHMGATLYSDRTMFLENNATITEELSRAKLIAHETAHMWFGDYVTMPWFNDVWTKEVFANWFASGMVSPMFPEIDHKLSFINTYYPASYSEDRTAGSNPVQQELDNLNRAGLVYGNIIYNKAPIVMEKLVMKTGEERFREGIREYLKRYAYSNASWDQLIAILDSLSDEDLTQWSNVWIKERGMPHIAVSDSAGEASAQTGSAGGYLYKQSDPLGRGLVWDQELKSDELPNADGMGYGLFVYDSIVKQRVTGMLTGNKINDGSKRISVIINLYENLDAGYLSADEFLNAMAGALRFEKNPLIFSRITGYLTSAQLESSYEKVEEILWQQVEKQEKPQFRSMAFSSYISVATSKQSADRLLKIWEMPEKFEKVKLGERELMRISYELALRYPQDYKRIKERQSARLTGADRKREFEFIYPALSPEASVRDSVFNSLLKDENRGVEPWAAASLTYLNHRLRTKESLKYITPALEIIDEIQRTGDIFFPSNWLRALLGGHSSPEAAAKVKEYMERANNLHPMLKLKILQQSHHLK